MIGVIFNHDIFDAPYKQSAVSKGLERLESICKNANENLCMSVTGKPRLSLLGPDMSDDYVTVHYTAELSDKTKAELADCIKEILTLKKTEYKNELPEIHIIFTKVAQNDYYCFNVK